MGYGLTLYMYTGIEQIQQRDGECSLLEWDFTDKQGEEARMIHVVMG